MNVTAIYPGTFDPITNGHIDLAIRASHLFDKVIVAVAASPGKASVFTLAERLVLVTQSLMGVANIDVCGFNGLLVDIAHDKQAKVIIRGLRAVSDFEYEFQLAGMNRHLKPDIETLFLTPAAQYNYISSGVVREIASLGGDIADFVAPCVLKALNAKSVNNEIK